MKKLECSKGNSKIGDDTIIINITSARDCPSRKLGLCRIAGKCYADKAERQYPSVLPYRRRQTQQFDALTAEDIAERVKGIVKRRRKQTRYLRFSESGDFRNQADIVKLSRIADLLMGTVKVYGYTARHDLDFRTVSPNMIVNGSGFMVHNIFTAMKDTDGKDKVCGGNCRTCNMCKDRHGADIAVKVH